jgi:hypothetical protein
VRQSARSLRPALRNGALGSQVGEPITDCAGFHGQGEEATDHIAVGFEIDLAWLPAWIYQRRPVSRSTLACVRLARQPVPRGRALAAGDEESRMPCIFCIAVIAMIAGAMAAGAVDQVEDGLADKAAGTLRRAADTDTVTKWDLTVKVGSRSVPLAVTLFKDHGRVRVQVLTHELSPQQVQKLLREICEAIGAKMVSQSSPDDQAHAEADHDAEPAAERQSPPPERRSEAAPDSEPPERQRRR